MIVDTAEFKCTKEVLMTLLKHKAKYGEFFKRIKVSHVTLQKVLKELEKKKYIQRHELGIHNTEYEITESGREVHNVLSMLEARFS